MLKSPFASVVAGELPANSSPAVRRDSPSPRLAVCRVPFHSCLRRGSPGASTVPGLCLARLFSHVLARPQRSASAECLLCQEFSRFFSAEEKRILHEIPPGFCMSYGPCTPPHTSRPPCSAAVLDQAAIRPHVLFFWSVKWGNGADMVGHGVCVPGGKAFQPESGMRGTGM